ncbi:molybdopterin-dependent oxidoreductase [Mesorhizobium sediminum]|nr:molybdopterin-dependent oxidoreductase [Mesorhizobium sediminum]
MQHNRNERFDVDLTLTVPLAAHASIEPRTAVARFDENGGLEVWTGTQDPFFARNSLADAFGLGRDKVVVRGMRIGGGSAPARSLPRRWTRRGSRSSADARSRCSGAGATNSERASIALHRRTAFGFPRTQAGGSPTGATHSGPGT